MSWLSALAESLFSSLFQAIVGWWKEEQAAAAQSEAQARRSQLESVRAGMAVQAGMAQKVLDAQASAPTSGAGWNATLLVLCLLSSGCFRFYVYTHPYQPVLPLVERPVLEDDSAFSAREQALATYASQLEAAVAEARAYALEQNIAQGYPVDPAAEAWLKAYRSK